MLSSSLLVSSLYNSSTYSAHLSITSSFSTKAFPCLPLIVCSPLFPFGRSSLIFWYINWLCALSNISISLHLSSEYLSLASRHSFRISFFNLLYCSSAFMFLHTLLSSIFCNISEFIHDYLDDIKSGIFMIFAQYFSGNKTRFWPWSWSRSRPRPKLSRPRSRPRPELSRPRSRPRPELSRPRPRPRPRLARPRPRSIPQNRVSRRSRDETWSRDLTSLMGWIT